MYSNDHTLTVSIPAYSQNKVSSLPSVSFQVSLVGSFFSLQDHRWVQMCHVSQLGWLTAESHLLRHSVVFPWNPPLWELPLCSCSMPVFYDDNICSHKYAAPPPLAKLFASTFPFSLVPCPAVTNGGLICLFVLRLYVLQLLIVVVVVCWIVFICWTVSLCI